MQQSPQPLEHSPGSVLAALRAIIPMRSLGYRDALLLAERAATRLLGVYGITALPVPTTLVSGLPRIYVEVDRTMPSLTSGSSVWDSLHGRWVITLNGREPVTRQRFTMLHEFFHILVHRHVERCGLFARLRADQIEYVADYFAGCALVPKRLLNQAWASGIQAPDALAEVFDVSPRAIAVRLNQVRLTGDGDEYKEISRSSSEAAS